MDNATESEQSPEKSNPTQNWMERGNAYAATLAVKAEYTEKERTLQERQDVSASTKKQLQAFLRMEQVTAEASAQGQDLGTIKLYVDGMGVVIFTLPSGGTIRDTGKEIFFSSHDPKSERAVLLYAGKKRGKRLTVEKGHIMFQSERHTEPKMPELEKRRKGLSR